MPDIGLLRGIITLITLLTFLGICWWAYRPANRRRFDEDAWMAFDDHEIDALGADRENESRQDRRQEEGGRA